MNNSIFLEQKISTIDDDALLRLLQLRLIETPDIQSIAIAEANKRGLQLPAICSKTEDTKPVNLKKESNKTWLLHLLESIDF